MTTASRPAPQSLKYALLLLAVVLQIVEMHTPVGISAWGCTVVTGALATAGLVCAAHIRIGIVRWLVAIGFATSAWFFSGYRISMGVAMTHDVFVTMFGYRSSAGLAVAQYGPSIVWSALASLPLLLGIGLKPARSWPMTVALGAPLALCVAGTSYIGLRGDQPDNALVGAYTPVSYGGLMVYDAATGTATPTPASQPSIPRINTPPQRDIVLIIDESIAPLYLDINDARGAYTGLARPREGYTIANFGIASAITNCTNPSNQTLRHGGRRDTYRSVNHSGLPLFGYAKAAGYQTVYIDTQMVGGELHNAMTAQERAMIDRFIQYDALPPIDRDHAAAAEFARLLSDDRAQFIQITKQGAHFPVHASYPASHRIFTPVPAADEAFAAREWTPRFLSAATKDWQRYRNAYRNTIAWNVGGFFDQLFREARPRGATILYTSDHGQDLHERGTPGTNTHCTPWPTPVEAAVPLVMIEAGAHAPHAPDWTATAQRWRNGRSHYQVFPTLLHLMGYDPAAVARDYGPALDDAQPDPMTFNTLFHARAGHAPRWQRVDPGALRRPPDDRASVEN